MSYIERYRPKEGEGHNKILIVTGLPGSGKDHLLAEANRLSMIEPSIRTFSFGEELFNYLKTTHPNIQTKDDIRILLTQDEVRQGVMSVINRLVQAQPAILSTHVVYSQRKSLIANPDVDKRMHPHGYLFVWSEPEQIAAWRAQDTGRVRPPESANDIALHQDIALEVVSVVARHTGASLKTLWNRFDNVADNLSIIQERAREISL